MIKSLIFDITLRYCFEWLMVYVLSNYKRVSLEYNKHPVVKLFEFSEDLRQDYIYYNAKNNDSGDSLETMRKLCLSTKFPHQEIRWN